MDDQGLQGSQGSQGSNAPQHPDSNMPDPNESRPYNPYRADVDPKPLEQRPRKHEDGKKLRKQNASGIFEFDVSVVRARYDDQAHKWMYTLNDWQNARIPGETQEKELKSAEQKVRGTDAGMHEPSAVSNQGSASAGK